MLNDEIDQSRPAVALTHICASDCHIISPTAQSTIEPISEALIGSNKLRCPRRNRRKVADSRPLNRIVSPRRTFIRPLIAVAQEIMY